MKKVKINIYPRVEKSELRFYKRLSDILGMLSIYPILSVLSVSVGGSLLLFVSESYLLLIAFILGFIIMTRKRSRELVLGAILIGGVIAVIAPYFLLFFAGIEEVYIGLAGKLLIFVASGLYIHEISRTLNMKEKLDKYGGLVVFGSLALLVREPIFILGGLILLALGFGGASTELRKLYYANLREN